VSRADHAPHTLCPHDTPDAKEPFIVVLAFLLRRLAWGTLVVLATALLAFGGTRALRPELYEGTSWLDGVTGDFRRLFSWEMPHVTFLLDHRSISQVLRDGWIPDVLFLAGIFAIGVPVGIAGGIYCANRRGRPTARALEWVAMFFFCTPVYVVGLTLLLLFAPPFGIWEFAPLFELHQYISPIEDPVTFLRAMAVPWLVTAAPLAAVVLRLTVSSIAEVMEEDYIRTAQGKGLSRRAAVRRHAAPASYLPVASFVSVSVPLIVTNMVLTEIVFNVPGVFRYFKKAIEGVVPPGPVPDYESLQIFAIYTAIFIVIGTILADMVVARLDPRIRTGEKLPS
jgi:peptide/nickel transport system permease protein